MIATAGPGPLPAQRASFLGGWLWAPPGAAAAVRRAAERAVHPGAAHRRALRPPLACDHPVLVRGGLFVVFASALWAFLPASRGSSSGAARRLGALLACFGSGAVLGAANIARARRHFGAGGWRSGTLLFAARSCRSPARDFSLAASRCSPAAGRGSGPLRVERRGPASLPTWVRARGARRLSVDLLRRDRRRSPIWARGRRSGLGGARRGGARQSRSWTCGPGRFRLREGRAPSPGALAALAGALSAIEPEPERGPVLVTIEYRIDPVRAAEFAR